MKILLLGVALTLITACGTKPPLAGDSLYSDLGGRETIDRIAGRFVAGVGRDPQIRPFFMNSNLKRFHQQFGDHICEVSGGPCEYTGDSMEQVHIGMDIDSGEFNRVVEILIDAMRAENIPYRVQNRLLARLAPFARGRDLPIGDWSMSARLELTLEAFEQTTVLDLLASGTEISRTRLKSAMSKGAVWLTRGKQTRRVRRATTPLSPGDRVSINYDESILDTTVDEPELIDDALLYSVWYKPAGVPSSGSRFGDHNAIDRLVEKRLDRAVFLVHRLDQYASGLMVLAHKKEVAARLSAQFQARTVSKTYQAVVEGIVSEPATIAEPLDGKDALTHVQPIDACEEETLVEVVIETGRKHQIRRHLASHGHPILGDRQYGHQHNHLELKLTAVELCFDSPTGERLRYSLPDAKRPLLTGRV